MTFCVKPVRAVVILAFILLAAILMQTAVFAEDLEFKGYGKKKIENIRLQEGLVTFEIIYPKPWAINASLHEKGGDAGRSMMERGPLQYSYAFNAPRDYPYYLTITCSGPWRVRIHQPRPSTSSGIPMEFSGKGTRITPFMMLDSGPVNFKLTKLKTGRYKIDTTLLDVNGNPQPDETGVFRDNDPMGTSVKTINIRKPGIYFMQVESEGDWRIYVEPGQITQ